MSSSAGGARLSFKEHMRHAREEAIIAQVNRLLAEKGFDAMTVDEVAAAVGVSKASLYKHFPSKEDLAAAAMARVMQQALDFVAGVDSQQPPLEKLKAATRWMLHMQLAGNMPTLPSQNSRLRAALMGHAGYMDALMATSDQLGGWIEAAQADGSLNPSLPPVAVLYTLYARACDPVVEFLKALEQYSEAEIVELIVRTCFDGLAHRHP